MSGDVPTASVTFPVGPLTQMPDDRAGGTPSISPGASPAGTPHLCSAEFSYQGSPRECGESASPCDITGSPVPPGHRAQRSAVCTSGSPGAAALGLGLLTDNTRKKCTASLFPSSDGSQERQAWGLRTGLPVALHCGRGGTRAPPWFLALPPLSSCALLESCSTCVARVQAGSEGRSLPLRSDIGPALPLLPVASLCP